MSRALFIIAFLVLAACGSTVQPAVVVGTPVPAPTTIVAATASPVPSTQVPATVAPTATVVPTATMPPTVAPTSTPWPTDPPVPSAEPTREALRYVFPIVATKYSVSTDHHDYPAADIACPIGSKFVAVTSGVVDFVSPQDVWPKTGKDSDKGGISVAIIGDDGVRYYGSHLSSVAPGIKPGVRVQAGQVLGLTGESGNAATAYPQLHFGISHPTRPDDWQVRRGEIRPQEYLKAWEQGKQVTPKLP